MGVPEVAYVVHGQLPEVDRALAVVVCKIGEIQAEALDGAAVCGRQGKIGDLQRVPAGQERLVCDGDGIGARTELGRYAERYLFLRRVVDGKDDGLGVFPERGGDVAADRHILVAARDGAEGEL